jgi:E-phenylitaconyl-CoA hydratase
MPVHIEKQDQVGIVTLDRPEALNALDIASLRQLRAHLIDLRDDNTIRAIMLIGAGTRAFCVGADLKKTTSSAASFPEALFQSLEPSSDIGLYTRLIDLGDLQIAKPMIAAINGHCVGGGLELALQCDLRIASDNVRLGLPEVKVGSIPGVSGMHRLLKAVPAAMAMKMALTGDAVTAAAALQMGLVSDVFSMETLRDESLKIAIRIAANGPLAVQAVKRLARQTAHMSESDAQLLTELYWGTLRDTADRAEGRRAFGEKREPRYTGR